MPYKSEKIKIEGGKFDRRVKLTPEQKQEIYQNKSNLSQRALAKEYGVSRRTIQFILDPNKKAENLKRREERGGSIQYYSKEKHKDYVKSTRRYKESLKINGNIK